MENQPGGTKGNFDVGTIAKVKEWYQILFVPYAALFIPYVCFGTLAALSAYYLGVDEDVLKFKWIPTGIGVGMLFFLGISLRRWWKNRQARAISLNKYIKIIEEHNCLHFRQGAFVDYSSYYLISPVDKSTSEMTIFLEWHGSLDDLTVEAQDGCRIRFSRLKESSGINVIADFQRILKKGCRYPFSFILRFDNSNGLIRPFLKKVQPYLPELLLVQSLEFDEKPPNRFVESTYSAGYVESAERDEYKIVQGSRHDYPVHHPKQGKSYKIAAAD